MKSDLSMQGSWVAVPTPMFPDGSVNYHGFYPLVDFHAANGTTALLVTGSAGEVAMLTREERRKIMEVVAAYAKDKIRVFFGTSATTTEATIELTRLAEECGAVGAILTVPMYSLPSQTAILDYFSTVTASVSFPVGVYNNPARVNKNIAPETIATLFRELPNFCVDKEASPDVSQIVSVRELAGEGLAIFACDNPGYGLLAAAVTLGHGMANITGNLDPRGMAALSRPLGPDTDLDEWRRCYLELLPLMRVCYALTNPVTVKCALGFMGLDVGPTRLPLQPVTGRLLDEVERVVRAHDLRAKYSLATVGSSA